MMPSEFYSGVGDFSDALFPPDTRKPKDYISGV
jgi:hypothetical protein